MNKLLAKYKIFLYIAALVIVVILVAILFSDDDEKTELSKKAAKHYFDKTKSVTRDYLEEKKKEDIRTEAEVEEIDRRLSEVEARKEQANDEINVSDLRSLSDLLDSI